MNVRLHSNFLDSLLALSRQDQARVRRCIQQIMSGHDSKGLRLHKVGDFWSYSASMSLRLIAWMEGLEIVILHADQHDAAYQWADRNRAVASEGKLIGLVETSDGMLDEKHQNHTRKITSYDPVYDSLDFQRYVSIGLPIGFAKYLASVSEDDLLDTIAQLSAEWQEEILTVACGGSPSGQTAGMPSDIYLVTDDHALELALSFPEAKWRLFLHPRQRFAVNVPAENHLILKGGPGTGKTVTAVHRFARLYRDSSASEKRPAFLALTHATRLIILEHLRQLGLVGVEDSVVEIEDFGKGQSALLSSLKTYSGIVIDEGQDIPVRYIADLMPLLEQSSQSIPPHFIAIDPNQCIKSPSGDALRRLEAHFDTMSLHYSYRSTRQNLLFSLSLLNTLHDRFKGRRFQDDYQIESSRDSTTALMVSPLHGPRVTIDRFGGREELLELILSTLDLFDQKYSGDYTKAIIAVASTDVVSELREDAKALEINAPVLEPIEAKGMEFFAGVVVDLLDSSYEESEGRFLVTSSKYKQLSGLYVAVTRFRDRVKCLYCHDNSPFNQMEIWNA